LKEQDRLDRQWSECSLRCKRFGISQGVAPIGASHPPHLHHARTGFVQGDGMIVLLVGPSAVGKTSAFQAVESQCPDAVFRHLDGLAAEYAKRHGWIADEDVHVLREHAKNDDHFLAIGLQAIADLAARTEGKHLIIDVGAGFQEATYATRLPYYYPAIALIASQDVVYRRWRRLPNNTLSIEQFSEREFSERRRALYGRCQHQIDTTCLSLEDTAAQLATALRGILG
jgi:hypothetical protein